ncbi:unnamed protein product [Dibothriocephalus latus]|uniref:Uncharacterized protein n=1 Tax=Dibothriocephalus latus TaxID=60516 RepID=A0A3P7NUI7_DIBLA|nr:unnamed protein product [Dibothriocephalus latus]
MSSSEVAHSIQSGMETALNKLSFWLDTVRAFIESNKASLGGHFDQETVLARLKVNILLCELLLCMIVCYLLSSI